LSLKNVVPGWRQGVFEVSHKYVGAGVERVDHHFALDMSGNFDATIIQVGRRRTDLPVATANLFGLGQKIRLGSAIQLALTDFPLLEQLFAAAVELALQ
jgi:hypothetical protein